MSTRENIRLITRAPCRVGINFTLFGEKELWFGNEKGGTTPTVPKEKHFENLLMRYSPHPLS